MSRTTAPTAPSARASAAYARLEHLIAEGAPIFLDGGNATELEREHAGDLRNADRGLWGT